MKKNGYEEFIKIDTNNLYINKNIISSLLSNANKFFKSFEDFAKDANKKLDYVNKKLDYFEDFAKDANKKLDYLIGAKSQNDINTNNRPAFILNSKEKQPEDSKSKSNSKKSENVSASESTPFNEENGKESVTSKMPLDSIRKRNEKKKNIIEKNNQNNANISSTSINSQFFLYNCI